MRYLRSSRLRPPCACAAVSELMISIEEYRVAVQTDGVPECNAEMTCAQADTGEKYGHFD